MRLRDLLKVPKFLAGVEKSALTMKDMVERNRPKRKKKDPYNGNR